MRGKNVAGFTAGVLMATGALGAANFIGIAQTEYAAGETQAGGFKHAIGGLAYRAYNGHDLEQASKDTSTKDGSTDSSSPGATGDTPTAAQKRKLTDLRCQPFAVTDQNIFTNPDSKDNDDKYCAWNNFDYLVEHAAPKAKIAFAAYSMRGKGAVTPLLKQLDNGATVTVSTWKGDKDSHGHYSNDYDALHQLQSAARKDFKNGGKLILHVCENSCYVAPEDEKVKEDHHIKGLTIDHVIDDEGKQHDNVSLIGSDNRTRQAGDGQFNNAQMIVNRQKIYSCLTNYIVKGDDTKTVPSFPACKDGPYELDFSPGLNDKPYDLIEAVDCSSGKGVIRVTANDFMASSKKYAQLYVKKAKEGCDFKALIDHSKVKANSVIMRLLKQAGTVYDVEVNGGYVHSKLDILCNDPDDCIVGSGSASKHARALSKTGTADESYLIIRGKTGNYAAQQQLAAFDIIANRSKRLN